MAKLYQSNVKIIENKTLSPNIKLLVFSNSLIAKESFPGKFLSIDCSPSTFFRRPFCISGINGIKIEILYRIIGPGTKVLAEKRKGDILNVFGPLGNGFPKEAIKPKITPVLIAGGTGIASLRYLAQKFNKPGILFYGAKTKKEIPPGAIEIFKKKKWQINISTDDGSLGAKCNVCELFNGSSFGTQTVVFACGPKPMLKEVIKITEKNSLKCFISLEEKMACGVGACRGCVTKVKNFQSKYALEEFVYKTVCKDGPVFDSKEIILD
ncbi:MAG: dihydroorotate dehydrogenase electron transfer subunit [Elusimicrobia bacterium]|nr:dihydroorotate dehydrogenase electron transfer subunit [Elusimicrobiota bacterium]MBU2614079.1 dihydroorotate dehydrogenase electron transfer subunit [Elusimicrobiota bacterium]